MLQEPPHPGTDIPRALIIRQPLRQTNVRGEPMAPAFLALTVEKHFERDIRTETYQIGTEGGTVGVLGSSIASTTTRFSVRWDGDRLRIESRTYPEKGAYTEHVEVWSLDEDGRLLITVLDRQSSEVATRTATYRRQ